MHRIDALAGGAALALVAGFTVACGSGDEPATEEVPVAQTAQTVQSELPVVTVYKTPT